MHETFTTDCCLMSIPMRGAFKTNCCQRSVPMDVVTYYEKSQCRSQVKVDDGDDGDDDGWALGRDRDGGDHGGGGTGTDGTGGMTGGPADDLDHDDPDHDDLDDDDLDDDDSDDDDADEDADEEAERRIERHKAGPGTDLARPSQSFGTGAEKAGERSTFRFETPPPPKRWHSSPKCFSTQTLIPGIVR